MIGQQWDKLEEILQLSEIGKAVFVVFTIVFRRDVHTLGIETIVTNVCRRDVHTLGIETIVTNVCKNGTKINTFLSSAKKSIIWRKQLRQ